MPGMSRSGAPGRAEPALVVAPGRDAAVTAAVVALTACAFAAAGDHGALASIQRLDDAWLRLMISGRVLPLTAIAKVFNVLGHEYVTLPVRIAITGLLALRRWWWHLAAFTAAMVVSEVLIGLLKGIYSRARPLIGSLVATSGPSFPSGHAVAASVTVVAAVIALVPAGRRRGWWGAAAVMFSILMGLSRAYLGAHWLSDAVAGTFLGTSCALVTALVAGQVQRRRPGRQPARAEQPADVCLAET